MDIYRRPDEVFLRGSGMKLYDKEDKEYMDLVSGIAVNTLGHCNSRIIRTIEEQSKKLIHLSNIYNTTEQENLARKLVELSDHSKVFFCNSGTEAVEGALKVARKYGRSGGRNKGKILYMKNSFHGRSLGALSVTGQEKYQKEFMPLVGNTQMCFFNDIDDVRRKIVGACAIILEPIQGEGGLVEGKREFLRAVRELCDRWDCLLIFDEIQCGVGRTGSFYAYEEFGVVPDIVCMAKGLGGGIPIGAVLVNERADVLKAGDHGTTFGGNPLACAVGSTVVDELTQGGILEDLKEKCERLDEILEGLKERYPLIEQVRGMGLLKGVKLTEAPKKFIEHAYARGCLLAGAGDDVVRIIPPLNIDLEDLGDIERKLDEIFGSYEEEL